MADRRILVIGGDGRLGRELRARVTDSLRFTLRGELDISAPSAGETLRAICEEFQPTALINAAAFTDVDGAESDPTSARTVNALVVGEMGVVARELGFRAVHISTDYVFDGSSEKAYREDDRTNPLSVYGKTKLEGEQRFLDAAPDGLIVRACWLFGREGDGFPATILRLVRQRGSIGVVTDELGCPTYHGDLAEGVLRLLGVPEARGVVHFANSGVVSRFEQAREACRLVGLDPEKITATTRAEIGRPANRPAFSALATSRFRRLTGWEPPDWKDAMRRALAAEPLSRGSW